MRCATGLFILLLFAGSVVAADFHGVKFLMVSSADHAVVTRDGQGDLKLLKQGDVVDEEHRIIGFEDNIVVLEGPGDWAPEKIFVEVTSDGTNVTRVARRPVEKFQMKGGVVTSFKAKSQ